MKIDGKRSQSQIKNGDILLSYIGLLCQGKTPAFLKQTLKLSHQLTDKQLLIRMDAGNDAAENLGILIEDGSWFIVKRNLRRGESKDEWISKVRECCKDIRHPRDGKTVYIGSSWKDVEYTDNEYPKTKNCVCIIFACVF